MPQKRKLPRDPNQRAKSIADIVAAMSGDGEPGPNPQDGKDPERVAGGKLGGAKGGKLRAERLSAERRAEIAQAAARARWEKR